VVVPGVVVVKQDVSAPTYSIYSCVKCVSRVGGDGGIRTDPDHASSPSASSNDSERVLPMKLAGIVAFGHVMDVPLSPPPRSALGWDATRSEV